MRDVEMARRIKKLEERADRIEQQLGLADPAEAPEAEAEELEEPAPAKPKARAKKKR